MDEKQNTIKIFGLLEHLGFCLIFLFLVIFIFSNDKTFVYFALLSWLLSTISHFVESKLENKPVKKIIVGV